MFEGPPSVMLFSEWLGAGPLYIEIHCQGTSFFDFLKGLDQKLKLRSDLHDNAVLQSIQCHDLRVIPQHVSGLWSSHSNASTGPTYSTCLSVFTRSPR